jgi:hypothetical protein
MGAALGAGYGLVLNAISTDALSGTDRGPLFSGVLLPVVMQVLMVAGPLLLLSRSHFDGVLDGLTFGVAAALGFTVAMVVAGEWHVLTAELRGTGVPGDSVLRIVRAGVIAAVVNASTTGLITATLWVRRHGRSRAVSPSVWRGLEISAAVALLVQVGLGLASYFIRDLLLQVVVWAIAAAPLLVWLRIVLHHALLEEGGTHHVGPPGVCPECHNVVPTMLFCPSCGVARSASPRHARGAGAGGGETGEVTA